jgi:ABC-type cobalamin/Fe3+-siderophores transport system ATPase subunit
LFFRRSFKYVKEANENGNNPAQVSSYIAMGRHKNEVWFDHIESASAEKAMDAIEVQLALN